VEGKKEGKEEGRMYKPILVMIQVPVEDVEGGRQHGEVGASTW
jgi:hypothetical protein